MGKTQFPYLDILANHYNETFGLLKADVGKRDRLFLYMLIVIFLLLLYMGAPTVLSDWINSFIVNQAGGANGSAAVRLIDVSYMGTILWFGFLCLCHTYFQTVLHVERQYNYVYDLEKQISKYFDGQAFIREGKHYQDNKRKFSSWTKVIFWALSPFLILIFLISWQIFLFSNPQTELVHLLINSLISFSMIISMGLYLWALYRKK